MMRHELGKWNLDELVKNPTRTIFDQKLAKIESDAKRFEKIKKQQSVFNIRAKFVDPCQQ